MIGDQIKKLRKELGLTQEEFSSRLGVKRNTVAQYEIGRNEPIDSVISLICREYGVSETWLRTGEGEMLIPQTRDEQISDFMGKLLANPEDTFLKQFIRVLSGLSSDDIKVLAKISDRLMEEKEKDGKP